MSNRARGAKQAKHGLDDGGRLQAAAGGRSTLLTVAVVAVLAGIPFVLGKYFELSTPDPYDSAANIYTANRVLAGAKLGVDEYPSADTGTLFVNVIGVAACGYSEVGPKLLQGLFQAVALIVVFVALRRIFGTAGAAVSVVLASLYLSAPLIAKFGNVKEQFMIACMMLGAAGVILRYTGGRWWWSLVAGAAIGWAPLFKPTGVSIIVATAVFVLAQPLLKRMTWRQSGREIGLLLLGVATGLLPVCVWLAWQAAPAAGWPYAFVWGRLVASAGDAGASYASSSWANISFDEVLQRYLRYCGKLILPLGMALLAVVVCLARWIGNATRPAERRAASMGADRFVLLLGTWWLCDAALALVSPRLYEQYFLPMTGSAAVLAGYLPGLWRQMREGGADRRIWNAAAVGGVCLMMVLAYPIVFGVESSPHSGVAYRDARGIPARARGYVQKLEEVSEAGKNKGPWQVIGEGIRQRTSPGDTIYVWGWYPGIYVTAQRQSASPRAGVASMHTISPKALEDLAKEMVASFTRNKPKFIVDTRKGEFPWKAPPLELWPIVPLGQPDINGRTRMGPLPDEPKAVEEWEASYQRLLAEQVGPEDAERFASMKVLRDYIRQNYVPAQIVGPHVVLERKSEKKG